MSDDLEGNVITPTEAEVEAGGFGWVPKEEFHGNPDEWKDAETFLKRGKEINGFLRNDLEKIKRTSDARAAEIAELRQTMDEFRKYHNETEERAYKRAFNDLKQAKIEAIEQGDGARVVEIDDQITSLKEVQKKEEPKPVTQKQEEIRMTPKELQEWRQSNTWYGRDIELSELTDDFAELVAKKNPELKGVEFLAAVTKKVKAVRPDAFENPNRSNTSVSSSGGSRPTEKRGKTYADLPVEAKAACDKFVKQGMLTKEKYVAEYFQGE